MNRISRKIGVVIADDHVYVRDAISEIVWGCDELELQAVVANGNALVKAVENYLPDIVLADIRMPEMDGLEACRIIKKAQAQTGMIAISADNQDYLFLQMLVAGFDGIILKSADKKDTLQAIMDVYAGENYYCRGAQECIHKLVLKGFYNPKKKTIKPLLNAKEEQILQLICTGNTTREIAVIFGLSERTIESYRENIFRKTGTVNLPDLVRYAMMSGMFREGQ